MARLGFFFFFATIVLPPYTVEPGFEPSSVELHQAGTFEGRSTDWAIALRFVPYDFNSAYNGQQRYDK